MNRLYTLNANVICYMLFFISLISKTCVYLIDFYLIICVSPLLFLTLYFIDLYLIYIIILVSEV